MIVEEEEILGIDFDAAVASLEGHCDGQKLRRIEVTCRLHTAERVSTIDRLAALESQTCFSADSLEVKSLKQKLQTLGEVPKRAELSKDEARALKKNAKRCALVGKVSIVATPEPIDNSCDSIPPSCCKTSGSLSWHHGN